MTRFHRHFLFVLSIVILLVFSVVYFTRAKPVKVLVSAAETGLVEQAIANTRAGTVKACRRSRLTPSTGGQIARLDIHEGDHVKAGQLLLELWNKDLQAEIALNEAESRAALASARAACLQAEVGQREADRLIRLRKSKTVSEDLVDKTVTEAKAREAECDSANARSIVSSARADVARAKLERTQLVAPFDGVIAEINGELNEYVTPSPPGIPTPPAVDLIDNSCFYVVAPIDEVDAPKAEIGQKARVTLDAFENRRFPGTVKRIASYVLDREKQARTVEVEVEFSNQDDLQQLLAGYSADVEIILGAHKAALRIPTEAVVDNDHVFVFIPDDGVLEERKITTGMSNWDYTEVLNGVKTGELVVTSIDRDGVEDEAPARIEQKK